MYEAEFAINDSTAYTDATADTDCQIELWCNEHSDFLYVSGSGFESVIEQVRTDIGIKEQLRGPNEVVVITASCLRQHETQTIERYLKRHNCLMLPPLRYENGKKHCRILALESANLTEIYTDLLDDGYPVEVHSKRTIEAPKQSSPLLSPTGLFPELTARQKESLVLAVANGYYELPRQTSTKELATELGVSRRTTEDHLRRAEQKILTALVEYLY